MDLNTFSTDELTALSDADLSALLERLEAAETTASKRRMMLHNRIEFVHSGGGAAPELATEQLASMQASERELSDRRLILHQKIDELRAERSRRLNSSPSS